MQISEAENRWLLSDDITMPQIKGLLAESKALSISGHLEIDLQSVTNVDTASISLLFEWLRNADARGVKVVFANLPQNLVSLAKLYGVLELLPQATHSSTKTH